MAAPTRNLFGTATTGATNSDTLTVAMATAASGAAVEDCICVYVSSDGGQTQTIFSGAGWEKLGQITDATSAVNLSLYRYMVTVAGTVPDLVVDMGATSEMAVAHWFRIRPSAANKRLILNGPTTAQGSSTNPNPASITNSTGATRDFYNVVVWGGDGNNVVSTAAPTNYANHQSTGISNTNGSNIGSADRTRLGVTNGTVEDPATFTRATEQWAAMTVGLYEIDINNLTANNLATGSPALGTPTLSTSSNPDVATLSDNFDDNSLDGAKWTTGYFGDSVGFTTAGTSVAETSGEIRITVPANDATLRGNGIVAVNAHDIRGSAMIVKLITPPSAGENIYFGISTDGTAANTYMAIVNGTNGTIFFYKRVAGTGSGIGGTNPFVAATHKWLRLRHDIATDTLFVDTAPDTASNPPTSGEWTNRFSGVRDAALVLSAVKPFLNGDIISSQASPAVMAFDGFNTATTTGVSLTADNLATGSPALGSPTITQSHALVANALATGSPAPGSPTLTQVHSLTANALAPASPALASPAVTQAHSLVANGLATGSPALGTPTISITNILAANNLATGSPVLGSPAIGQVHSVTANALATASPALGTPALAQVHALAANSLATASPALSSPAVTQTHSLSANPLATASPGLASPAIGQKHSLTANGLTTGAPSLDSPTLGLQGTLIANNLVTGSPALGSPAIGQAHSLSANGLATSAPALDQPLLRVTHFLAANGLATSTPSLGSPALSQRHGLSANDLQTGSPALASPAIGQDHALLADGLETGSPELGTPGLNYVLTISQGGRVTLSAGQSRVTSSEKPSRLSSARRLPRETASFGELRVSRSNGGNRNA